MGADHLTRQVSAIYRRAFRKRLARVFVLAPYILAIGGEIKTHSRFEPANALHINIIPNFGANKACLRTSKM